jgi:hypothetical protein
LERESFTKEANESFPISKIESWENEEDGKI